MLNNFYQPEDLYFWITGAVRRIKKLLYHRHVVVEIAAISGRVVPGHPIVKAWDRDGSVGFRMAQRRTLQSKVILRFRICIYGHDILKQKRRLAVY
jgi:hypothetical protein